MIFSGILGLVSGSIGVGDVGRDHLLAHAHQIHITFEAGRNPVHGGAIQMAVGMPRAAGGNTLKTRRLIVSQAVEDASRR